MVKPRWVALLLLALAIAGGFAGLGQWQLSRAVSSPDSSAAPTEEVVAIDTVASPGAALRDDATGQRVAVVGAWVNNDFIVVGDRVNVGTIGYWVTGHLTLTGSAGAPSLAVAIGWTDDADEAQSIADELNLKEQSGTVTLTGRLNASQAPEAPEEGEDPYALNTMSVAAFVNLWSGTGSSPVYNAYLVSEKAVDGLTVIDAPAVDQGVQLNWLNIFYAVEWVVFAGFAIFLWYRLVKDAWERQQEESELTAAAAEAGESPETTA